MYLGIKLAKTVLDVENNKIFEQHEKNTSTNEK